MSGCRYIITSDKDSDIKYVAERLVAAAGGRDNIELFSHNSKSFKSQPEVKRTSLRRVVRVLIWFLYSSSRWLAYVN